MNSVFNFNCTPDENKELNSIRSKYTPHNESKMDTLRALDRKVKRPANTFSYIFGALSALVMGAGMSLVMTDIGCILAISNTMVPGIIIGLVGLAAAIVNYPIHKAILSSRRRKYAGQIIALSDEIMKN